MWIDAIDLTSNHYLRDENGEYNLAIDYLEYNEDEETIYVEGFYVDSGLEYNMTLDADEEVEVSNHSDYSQ